MQRIIFITLFMFVFFSTSVFGQTLTISSGGQTGTSGTNWSVTGNTLTVTGPANIDASVIIELLSSNSLSIQGNSTSFAVNVSQAITSSASGNGLTIGAASNTGNISLNNAVGLAGSVTIFGGRVSIMDTFLLSSSNNLTITSINTVIASTTTVGGSATINASGNFILGTNVTAGTGFPLTATGGFTKTGAGTSYLFSSINTTNTAVTIAGPVVVGNFNTSNAITKINSNGGNISIPGAVSAFSGTGRDYMALVYANLYDAVGGAVAGSTTDIYLRFNSGNQSFVSLPGMPASFNLQYLLVAAGGAGGGSNIGVYSGGGGGGGGVAEGSITYTSGTPLNLVIGAGGIGVPGSGNINGLNGGDTGISDLGFWVGGGGGGGGSDGYNGNIGTGNNNIAVLGRSYLAGGGGGGSGRGNGNWISGGTGTLYTTSGQGTATSFGAGWWSWGGGGGGASGNGYYVGDLSRGGIGRSNSITGSSVEYGAGSGARDRTSTFGSGGTTNTSDAVAVNGSNGAMILRFALSSALDTATLSTAFHLNAIAGSVTLGSTVANLSTIEITAGIASSITGPITGSGSLLKTGNGALTLSGDHRYTGGTTVTTGTLVLNDTAPMDGLGVIVGTLNINQNGIVQLTGLASALGYNADRVTTININGGILESSTGQQHIWNLTGGLNFNGGGTLRTNGGTSNAAATSYFEWGVTNITVTNPTSPAEIAGRIHLRNDLGTSVFTVADGTAENDLLISAAITQSTGSNLTKAGAGKLTFTGINSYSGTTTISAGTLQIGSGGTLGTISAAGVTNNAALVFNRSDDFTISNVISGTGTVTKTGIGILTLSGANTHTGLTTISQGTLKCGSTTALGTIAGSTTIVDGAALDLNAFTLGLAEPITVNGTGLSASGAIYNSTITAVTLPSPITLASNATINGATGNLTLSGTINGAFALNVKTVNKTYTQSGIIGGTTPPTAYTVTVGNTGTATLSGATTAAGAVSISGGTLAVNANLTATANNVSLSAVTAVTQTAPITANGLDLNGAGTFTLTNTSNNIATLAGGSALSKLGSVNYMDSDGFSIGTVTNTGITTTGTITAETQLGNIIIAQNITTDNTTTSAITINAGKPKSIGDAIGGNVIISGTPVITTGVNGITKLFSGREAESTSLSTFVGASNVRLGVDETTVTFAPVLANNTKYALYRFNDATIGSITIVSSGGVALNNGWEFVNNTIIPTSAAAININASVLQNYLLTNPLTIRAGSITFSADIANTTTNQLTLNSYTFIKNTVATTITTQGGHVVMAANTDDATDGDTTTNGYIQFSSGLTMTTNGGNITLGGGDAAASGYALGTSAYPYEGLRVDGTLNINSGGGNIIMRGKSYAVSTTSGSWGMGFWNLSTGSITSGIGTITLDGFSQSSGGTHNSGIYTYGALTVTSTNTTADAIRMIGKATGTSGQSWGIEAESALSVLATVDGGGITISTSQLVAADNQDIVLRGETNILAKSGPINLLGGQSGGIANGNLWIGSTMYIGSKALSAVTSSSSNITMQYDNHSFAAYPYVATSGSVNWNPVSASFGQEVITVWFNWNQNSQTMSGLTIGKSGNTANITHQTNAITVAGPVSFMGGTLALNANLTATSNNVTLTAATAVTQTAPITANGLALNGAGTVTLNNTSNTIETIAAGTTGSRVGSLSLTDASGGITVGSVGSATGINTNAGVILVETLSGNINLNESISTNNTTTSAVILNAGKSSAIGNSAGGDIIVTGTPTITMGTGGIAKLHSGLEMSSTGLTTLVGGASNVRNNYDETTTTFSPVLSINNKYAIYRTALGVGDLTIVSSGGDALDSTWTYSNGIISTKTTPVNINASVLQNYLSTGSLTIEAGNVTISAAITSTANNAFVINSNGTKTITVNAAVSLGGAITFTSNDFVLGDGVNITTSTLSNVEINANNNISTTGTTRRTISSANGNIVIHADKDANGTGQINLDYLTFNPSTGNTIIRGETISWDLVADNQKPYINGTGSFTFESSDVAFGQTIYSYYFVIDQDNNGISSYTYGKVGNTSYVYVNSTFTVAGPIKVYGGYVQLENTLTSSANGDILLKGISTNNPSVYIWSGGIVKSGGTGTLTVQGHSRVIANAPITATGTGVLNVVLWSDYDNSNNDGGVSQLAPITTNGGHVWMGGSNSTGGSYTWNGLTVGDGPSVGANGYNANAMDIWGSVTTNGGDVLAWAGTGYTGTNGIASDGTRVINTGSGDITFIAPSTSGNIQFTTTGIISLVPNGVSYPSALTFAGTLSTGNFTFNTSHYNGLTINSLSSVGGLTIGKYTELLNSGTAVNLGNTSNITFSSAATIAGPIIVYGGTIALDANLTTTNNGDISLYTDAAIGGLTAARTITAAGSFNYIPRSDFFSASVTYPITNLNLTSAGLLIGKLSNTANITFGNATTIAGPITAYGGTVTLNANLTTTNNGSISLYSDNPLGGLSTARTLIAAGAFKYIPRTTTFTADVTYPIANLTATSTGLTIGNTTNDKNITITQDVTGGAGIELYGANVNINSNLKTTSSATMYLKGNTTIAAEKYIESNGNFTHDGNMTFKSTATGTATFGPLGGTFTTVSGTATVERYVPAKRGWRLLTTPLKGSSNNTVSANWQGINGEGMLLFSPATYQSNTMTGYTTGGSSPNIWKYNSGWQSIPNIGTETMFNANNTDTNAYLVFATGPQGSPNIVTDATETTLKPKGSLITGNVTHTLTANQYKLTANPYASPINTVNLVAANSGSKIWMVDPTIGTYGGYAAYDGSNWTPAIPTTNDAYIQSGQGFFVRAGINATFTISESHKVNGNSNTWFQRSTLATQTTESADKIRILLYKQDNVEWKLADGVLAVNSTNGNNAVDETDTNKMTNFNENIMFRNGTTNLAIEYSALPQAGYVQPMRLTATTIQPYQLRLFTENYTNASVTPLLEDTVAGTFTPIPTDGSVLTVHFSGISATSAVPDERFRIVYQKVELKNDDFTPLWVAVYPNPVKDGVLHVHLNILGESTNFTLTNLVGQLVHQGKLENIQNTVALPQLPEGMYLLSIIQEGKQYNSKIYIK